MSWIGLDDLLGVILHAAATPTLSGPVNAVSPAAIRAGEFARVLAHVVDRPLLMNLPNFVLRAMIGEVADAAVWSSRAVPDRLRTTGFRFAQPGLEQALRWELGMVSAEDAGVTIEHG
jgi:NAD dependent epimerase/dehydratase family enzyme